MNLEQIICNWISSLGNTRAIAIKLVDVRKLVDDILSIPIGGKVIVKRSTCDKRCNEYDFAECAGNDGECIMQKQYSRPRLLRDCVEEDL